MSSPRKGFVARRQKALHWTAFALTLLMVPVLMLSRS